MARWVFLPAFIVVIVVTTSCGKAEKEVSRHVEAPKGGEPAPNVIFARFELEEWLRKRLTTEAAIPSDPSFAITPQWRCTDEKQARWIKARSCLSAGNVGRCFERTFGQRGWKFVEVSVYYSPLYTTCIPWLPRSATRER